MLLAMGLGNWSDQREAEPGMWDGLYVQVIGRGVGGWGGKHHWILNILEWRNLLGMQN